MFRRLGSYSVFTLLLLNTVVSTVVVAVVSIASLQRVADEHPRRYLSKTLFHAFANSLNAEEMRGAEMDGTLFEVYRLDALPTDTGLPFRDLLARIERDPDGVAITTHNDRYIAATLNGDNLVVLPQFGRLLSTQAITLIGVVIATIGFVLLLNYFAIKYLTSPFLVFKRVVGNVDEGDLSYRIPIEKTYGEFRDLANSFNHMLGRLDHVNAARKHMLLAIPHEVRTPLARLKVRKDLIENPELKSEITRDINNLEEILDTILETERLQTNEGRLKRSEIAIEPFFKEVISEFRAYHGLHLILRTRRRAFAADPFLISLLAKNLISNSIRYGQGKPVTVEVFETEDNGNSLALSVADQGVGIPEDKIPYVVEPFWRLDESRQRISGGYGLGMYLCDRIVKVHDGKLEIHSKVGAGTTVTVTLPGALTPALS